MAGWRAVEQSGNLDSLKLGDWLYSCRPFLTDLSAVAPVGESASVCDGLLQSLAFGYTFGESENHSRLAGRSER